MTYASLLVHLQPGRSNTTLLLAAAHFADRFAAHVIGIAACQPLLFVSGDGTVCGDVFTNDQRQTERDLEGSHAKFRQHLSGHGKSLEWRSRIALTPVGTCLAAESRSTDRVMTGRVPADGLDLSSLTDPGARALEAGRPVFIVPPDARPMAFDHAPPGRPRRAIRLYRIVDERAVDFVVAGAYGHSRLREWVLGGVTRDLLLVGTRSVLVSH